MSKKIRYSLLAILSFIMVFTVFGSAAAQEEVQPGVRQEIRRPLRNRGTLRGEINAINGDVLTLDLPQRSVEILTTGETHFHIIGQQDASLSDFSVGDTILARGRRQEGALVANLILLQPEGDLVWGRVTAVDEDGLLLNGRDQQEISVNASPDTIVAIIGQELTWDGDLAGHDLIGEGALLTAFGTMSSDGSSLDAHTIVTQRPQRPQGLAGVIESIAGDSFTIMALRGEAITVLVNDDTHYRIPGSENPAFADLSIGNEVAIVGQPGEGNTFTARIVAVVPENRPHGRPVAGEITTINGDEISLERLNGRTITVITNPETIFRIGRDNEASLDDFADGDRVAVFGTRGEEEGTMLATHVMKRQ